MKLPPDAPEQPRSLGDLPTSRQDDAADLQDDADDDDDHDHDDELPDVSALVPLAQRLSALFPESTEDAPDDEPGDDVALRLDDLGDDDLGDDGGDDLGDDGGDDLGDDEDDPFYVEGEGSDFDDDDDGFEYGDDRSALDLTPEALVEAQAAATELVHALEGDIDRLFALEEATQTNLLGLLADLPLAVARTERIDEAAALASLLAPLDPPHFLGERALLLAGAGRREEALAQVTQNLETPTSDGWVEVKAAEVFLALDDPARAEALLRGAMENAEDERVQSTAFDSLLELLDSQGRHAEVKALLKDERARLDALVEPRNVTVQHATPKVGRNDPCPCGSGKKHKKCCLV